MVGSLKDRLTCKRSNFQEPMTCGWLEPGLVVPDFAPIKVTFGIPLFFAVVAVVPSFACQRRAGNNG
jgi:hypothetical protein